MRSHRLMMVQMVSNVERVFGCVCTNPQLAISPDLNFNLGKTLDYSLLPGPSLLLGKAWVQGYSLAWVRGYM